MAKWFNFDENLSFSSLTYAIIEAKTWVDSVCNVLVGDLAIAVYCFKLLWNSVETLRNPYFFINRISIKIKKRPEPNLIAFLWKFSLNDCQNDYWRLFLFISAVTKITHLFIWALFYPTLRYKKLYLAWLYAVFMPWLEWKICST